MSIEGICCCFCLGNTFVLSNQPGETLGGDEPLLFILSAVSYGACTLEQRGVFTNPKVQGVGDSVVVWVTVFCQKEARCFLGSASTYFLSDERCYFFPKHRQLY